MSGVFTARVHPSAKRDRSPPEGSRTSCLRQATGFSWRAARGISEPPGEQIYHAAEMRRLQDAPSFCSLYEFYLVPSVVQPHLGFQYSSVKKMVLEEEPRQLFPRSQHYLTLHVLSKWIGLIVEVLKAAIWNAIYLFNKRLSLPRAKINTVNPTAQTGKVKHKEAKQSNRDSRGTERDQVPRVQHRPCSWRPSQRPKPSSQTSLAQKTWPYTSA